MSLLEVERPAGRLELLDARRHFLRREKIRGQARAGKRDAELLGLAQAMHQVPKGRHGWMDD